MSHTYIPSVPQGRRFTVAAALVAAIAVGAVGGHLTDRLLSSQSQSQVPSSQRVDVEQARYDAYIDWLEGRSRTARGQIP